MNGLTIPKMTCWKALYLFVVYVYPTRKFGQRPFNDRSTQLSTGTGEQTRIYSEVMTLIKQMEMSPEDIRGVGISVSKLGKYSDK